MDARIRKLEINQMTLGAGVALFALWTFVRMALQLFVFNDELIKGFTEQEKIVVYLMVGGLSALILLNQLFVGLSARGEGKGKRKRIIYLIFDGIQICISVVFTVLEVYMLFTPGDEGILSMVASIVIEITLGVCLVEVMVNSIQLRKIRKSLSAEEKGGVA